MQTDHIPLRHPWPDPAAVLDGLAGRWSLERVVMGKDTNQGSMPQGSMRGFATFRRLDSGLVAYREEGRLKLPSGETFDAFRNYLYDRVPLGFAVFFAETPPRLFHEIRLQSTTIGTLIGEAAHLCGRDNYATRYVFQPDGSFVVHHDVSGPRKDYVMATEYRRIAP